MQTTRPSTIDKEVVEDFQHNAWINNQHTQVILNKLKNLAASIDKEAKICSSKYDTSQDSLLQMKLKLNEALLLEKVISYVQTNSFPTSNA